MNICEILLILAICIIFFTILFKVLDHFDIISIDFYNKTKNILFIRTNPNKESLVVSKNLWGGDVESQFIKEVFNDYKIESIPISQEKLYNGKVDVLTIPSTKVSKEQIELFLKYYKPKVVLFFGDEFSGEKDKLMYIANKVPLVYTQYNFNKYNYPDNVKTLPVGFHNWDTNISKNLKPVSERELTWSFIGSITQWKPERQEIPNVLADIKPNFFGSTNGEENQKIFEDSKFVICPKGNVDTEASRQWTATRYGALPILIVTDQKFKEAYGRLPLTPPWLKADNLEKAKKIILKMKDNNKELDKMQKANFEWYEKTKKIIREDVDSYL